MSSIFKGYLIKCTNTVINFLNNHVSIFMIISVFFLGMNIHLLSFDDFGFPSLTDVIRFVLYAGFIFIKIIFLFFKKYRIDVLKSFIITIINIFLFFFIVENSEKYCDTIDMGGDLIVIRNCFNKKN
jgi:hypothetical protein